MLPNLLNTPHIINSYTNCEIKGLDFDELYSRLEMRTIRHANDIIKKQVKDILQYDRDYFQYQFEWLHDQDLIPDEIRLELNIQDLLTHSNADYDDVELQMPSEEKINHIETLINQRDITVENNIFAHMFYTGDYLGTVFNANVDTLTPPRRMHTANWLLDKFIQMIKNKIEDVETGRVEELNFNAGELYDVLLTLYVYDEKTAHSNRRLEERRRRLENQKQLDKDQKLLGHRRESGDWRVLGYLSAEESREVVADHPVYSYSLRSISEGPRGWRRDAKPPLPSRVVYDGKFRNGKYHTTFIERVKPFFSSINDGTNYSYRISPTTISNGGVEEAVTIVTRGDIVKALINAFTRIRDTYVVADDEISIRNPELDCVYLLLWNYIDVMRRGYVLVGTRGAKTYNPIHNILTSAVGI